MVKYSCESRIGKLLQASAALVHSPQVWTAQTQPDRGSCIWQRGEHFITTCVLLLHSFCCISLSEALQRSAMQSQCGLYGHFALFYLRTATIPGTLRTQLRTMDPSVKAESFAHLQRSEIHIPKHFHYSRHQLKIEVREREQREKKLLYFFARLFICIFHEIWRAVLNKFQVCFFWSQQEWGDL